MVYTDMDSSAARAMIRAACADYKKRDPFLEYKKEEANEIFQELGSFIDNTNYKEWRNKIAQLYKEEIIMRYAEQIDGMHDNEIMVVETGTN